MGKVYYEDCPHCGEDIEVLAPKEGKKEFLYKCPYCGHKFKINRDEEDVLVTASNTAKALRLILWAIVIIFIIASIFGFFNESSEDLHSPSYLIFDIDIPANVYINGGFVGTISDGRVQVKSITCYDVLLKVEYEEFVWEKVVSPCKIIRVNQAYSNYLF